MSDKEVEHTPRQLESEAGIKVKRLSSDRESAVSVHLQKGGFQGCELANVII